MRNRSSVCAGAHRPSGTLDRFFARLTGSLALLACVAAGGAAHAGPKDFMIFTPGLGGDAEQAKPYIDRFGQFLDKLQAFQAMVADTRDVLLLSTRHPLFDLLRGPPSAPKQ